MSIKHELTSKGWDDSSSGYSDMMKRTGFTRMYAQDLLDETLSNEILSTGDKQIEVLDIATGTGAMSIIAAKRVKPYNGSVLATDFSPSMINFLNKEIQSDPSLDNIKAEVMDGQNLTIGDNSIDVVYIVFGLMFFPNQKRGVDEMYRVLKSGGTVGITTWSNINPTGSILINTIKRLNPDFQQTGPAPVNSLADPIALETLFGSAGFVNVKVQGKEHTLRCNIDEFVEFTKGNPVFTSVRDSLPKDKQPLFSETLRQVAMEQYPSGNLDLGSLAYLTTAKKP